MTFEEAAMACPSHKRRVRKFNNRSTRQTSISGRDLSGAPQFTSSEYVERRNNLFYRGHHHVGTSEVGRSRLVKLSDILYMFISFHPIDMAHMACHFSALRR